MRFCSTNAEVVCGGLLAPYNELVKVRVSSWMSEDQRPCDTDAAISRLASAEVSSGISPIPWKFWPPLVVAFAVRSAGLTGKLRCDWLTEGTLTVAPVVFWHPERLVSCMRRCEQFSYSSKQLPCLIEGTEPSSRWLAASFSYVSIISYSFELSVSC